ncbi:hypothetical protein [Aquimarina litoralis]|uniref:hypothetical protein n=1 Tax=Aquimarina litoralis TaxID=584605 RepID=UPI001C568D6C|nr:hypothetical protein [Aquimarina litoralis]MBW1294816.1 hypothetical protein [Aquimarina litoralis]
MKKLKFTTIVLSLFSLTISCSIDDSTPEPQTESFKVKAVSIVARQFPDTEGEALELYGRISTTLAIGDNTVEHILWDRNRDFFESVGAQEFLINSEGSEHTFTLTEDELRDGAEFRFYTQMYDRDPDGNIDDYLGNELRSQFVRVFSTVSNENNPVVFDFRLTEFTGVDVRVRFSVEHIR